MADREPERASPGAGGEAEGGAAWICPACGLGVQTAYCPTCGERRFSTRDVSLAGLLAQAVETLTNADGRLYRTCRALVLRPGVLTAAYLRGERKPYIAPFPLFLLANVVFFLLQSVLGFQVLSNPLESHLNDQVYSELASSLTTDRVAARGTSLDTFAAAFDHAVTVNAKALVVLLVPAFALVVFLLYPAFRRPAATHFVFGLHFVAFWLLFLGVFLPIIGWSLALVLGAIAQSEAIIDPIASWILMGVLGVYAYRAFGVVYGGLRWARILKAALLAFLLIPLIRIYRFVVFLITLYTT